MQGQHLFTPEVLKGYMANDFQAGQDFRPADGAVIPYAEIAAIYNAMPRPIVETYRDQRLIFLHKTLTWWVFHRQQGVSVAAFAERMGVSERTVFRWLKHALAHIETRLKAPDAVVFPATYLPFEQMA